MTTRKEARTNAPIWFHSRREMSLGLMLPVRERSMGGETPSFEDVVEMAGTARDAGFEAIWFADHFTMGDGDDVTGAWEAWTMMAALAARIPDVQVGTMVSCTGFRNPGVIAKMAEAVDEISGGRLILGLGAGWNEIEYRQFGFPFDYRASRFEESIQIVHPLLRRGEADFRGRFFQANNAVNQPRGPRPDGIPLLIGSNGDRLLHSVARYADAWNSDWESDLGKMTALVDKVDAACAANGRDPSTLVKTGMARFALEDGAASGQGTVTGSVDEMVARLVEMRALGLKHFVCGLEPRTRSSIESFGDVIVRLDAHQ